MAGHGNKSRKREQAIAALLTASNVSEAAHATGIGSRTLERWLQQPEFSAMYKAARRRLLDAAILHLRREAFGAVHVLAALAHDSKVAPAARVSASGKLLDCCFKFSEVEDLKERVNALEKKSGGTRRNG